MERGGERGGAGKAREGGGRRGRAEKERGGAGKDEVGPGKTREGGGGRGRVGHPEVRARHNPKSSSVTNTYPDTPDVNTYMYKHSDNNTTVVTQ